MLQWRAIPGFRAYEISTDDMVRHTMRSRFPGRYLTPSGKRYLRCTLINDAGKIKYCYIHRLMCLTFIGPSPSPKHEAAHFDDNKKNNTLSNLRWATRRENAEDCIRNGCQPKGEKHGKARLTKTHIKQIKRLRREGMTYKELGFMFNTDFTNIFKIVKGINWANQ